MVNELIPLYSVRFFEAAARHSSFLKAANEMHITPAAVAHQIKQLETSLGVELFDRFPKGVSLNEDGRELLKYVQRALDELQRGSRHIRSRSQTSAVRIVALHGFIERWMFPRLQGFRAMNPGIRIEMRTSEKPVSLNSSGDHIWISHCDGPPSAEGSELLFTTRMSPICSPKLVEAVDQDFDLLLQQPKLYDTFWNKDWSIWLDEFGTDAQFNGQNALGFDLYNMVVQAAVDGMGLAIGHDALVQREIDEGTLVYPFNLFCDCPKSFYLTTRVGHLSNNTQAFLSWIREEAALQRRQL